MSGLRASANVAVLALGAALLGAGCGAVGERAAAAPTARLVRFSAHGLTVALPPHWRPADERLTPALSDPREMLAVATFALRYRRTACAHVAGSALEDMGRDDAFVTLRERGLDPGAAWSDFPERPAHFGPELGGAAGLAVERLAPGRCFCVIAETQPCRYSRACRARHLRSR